MQQPAFRRISARFKFNGNTYPGEAIASSQAIYLILKGSAQKWWMAIPGGIIGWIVAKSMFSGIDPLMLAICASVGLLWLLAAIFMPEHSPRAPILNGEVARVMSVKDLPEEIRRHANWPHDRTEKAELRPVIIIPRMPDLVIDHKKYSNLLTLQVEGINVQMDYLLGQGAQIRDYLLDNGWQLIWAGEKLAARAVSSETDAGVLVSP